MQPRATNKKEGCALLIEKEDKQLKEKTVVFKTQGNRQPKPLLLLLKRSIMINPLMDEEIAIAIATINKFEMQ